MTEEGELTMGEVLKGLLDDRQLREKELAEEHARREEELKRREELLERARREEREECHRQEEETLRLRKQ